MKIEHLISLRERYLAQFDVTDSLEQPMTGKGIQVTRWETVELVGLVEGIWEPLVLDHDGVLKPARLIHGFKMVTQQLNIPNANIHPHMGVRDQKIC